MFSTRTELTSRDSAPLRLDRILAVLTQFERRDFFPGPMLEEIRELADVLVIVDPLESPDFDLAAVIKEVRPTVLVACWKTPPLPESLPDCLRYVCYLCGSVKKLVSRKNIEEGLLVTNWGGSISRIVAEWAMFHILSSLRRACYWTIAMHQEGGWKNEATETASLFGRTVGLHGFGLVARELVRLIAPFGCPILVFAPDVDGQGERRHGVRNVKSLDDLFDQSDVIVELAPLIPETEGIVTEHHLRLLKDGAVFVNVGRGAVVDEEALVRVARESRVQFGLDVFSTEPLPPDHPLRGMLNVSLTPHLAGPTTDRRQDAGAFALNNLRAFASGSHLQALVTTEVYDRST